MSHTVHEIRHSSAHDASRKLLARTITIRARASDWCRLSALMAAVSELHPDSEVGRHAAEWGDLLDDIAEKEGLT